MKKSQKIKILKKLVARGELLCARVCADDWGLIKEFTEIVNK